VITQKKTCPQLYCSSDRDDEIGRIGRSESLGGYGDQDVLEVRKVKSFESLGRSEFMQLHVDCVSYHSGDYRAESLVHTFTIVLHVVHTHINISIYYSVVLHGIILDKNLSWT
jgi:hypothetical protein